MIVRVVYSDSVLSTACTNSSETVETYSGYTRQSLFLCSFFFFYWPHGTLLTQKCKAVSAEMCEQDSMSYQTISQQCATPSKGFGTSFRRCAAATKPFGMSLRHCETDTDTSGTPSQCCAAAPKIVGALSQFCDTNHTGGTLLPPIFDSDDNRSGVGTNRLSRGIKRMPPVSALYTAHPRKDEAQPDDTRQRCFPPQRGCENEQTGSFVIWFVGFISFGYMPGTGGDCSIHRRVCFRRFFK